MNASYYNFGRPIVLHVCKDGTVSYRDKSKKEKVFNGRALPVYTVDTIEQAQQIQIRFCRLQYGSHPQMKAGERWYKLNTFSGELEDLDRVAKEFHEFYEEHLVEKRIFIRVTSHRAREYVLSIIGDRESFYSNDSERRRGRSFGIYLVTRREEQKLVMRTTGTRWARKWTHVRGPYDDLHPCIDFGGPKRGHLLATS